MKKHKHGIREKWIFKRSAIVQVIGIVAILAIFSAGIFGVYVWFAPKEKTKETVANSTSLDLFSANKDASTSAESASTAINYPTASESIMASAATSISSITKSSASGTSSTGTSSASAAASITTPKTDGKAPDLTGYVVVLDPGHQLHANSEQESLGPDMSGTKDKCSAGTSGVSTGRPEYKVNLEIGLKMRDYLESLGCTVYMTRTTNDVDISNIDRAKIALSHSPDVYIRLHCDGSTNSASRGIGVFVADTGKYSDSLSKWGDLLGEALSSATGAKYRGCNASSVYSGLNWAASIPSFLLEMGFMSNATDDKLLSDPDYQQKICEGAAVFVSQMPHING